MIFFKEGILTMKQKITPDINTIQDQVKELNHPTTNDSTVLQMQQYEQNNMDQFEQNNLEQFEQNNMEKFEQNYNIIHSQDSIPQDYNPIRTNKSIFSCWKI